LGKPVLELFSALGQPPRVGGTACRATAAAVDDETLVFQAREDLRDLALVDDPRPFSHFSIAARWELGDRPQDLYGAVGQAGAALLGLRATLRQCLGESGPRSLTRWRSVEFLARDARTQIGEHDQAHELSMQLDERRLLNGPPGRPTLPQQARVENREHRAHDALCHHWAGDSVAGGLCAPAVHDLAQLGDRVRAEFEHTWTAARGVHDAQLCQERLLVEEAQHRRQAAPERLSPTVL